MTQDRTEDRSSKLSGPSRVSRSCTCAAHVRCLHLPFGDPYNVYRIGHGGGKLAFRMESMSLSWYANMTTDSFMSSLPKISPTSVIPTSASGIEGMS